MDEINELGANVLDRIRNRMDEFELLTHLPVKSCHDVHKILHVSFDRIVKCLLLKSCLGKFVVAAVASNKRVNIRAVEHIVGYTLVIADPRDVLRATGCPIGAVSPIGLPVDVPVVMDKGLDLVDKVYFGTGKNRSSLATSGRVLIEVASAIVADIAQ